MVLPVGNAILSGMTLRMDKAGRVVLPKPLRDRLGLHEGSALELREAPDGLFLKAEVQRSPLVRSGRFLVHTGDLPRGYDILGALDDEREDRDRKLAGF